MDQFDNRFKKIQKLGEGTYGDVFLALDQKTNQHVAIKKMKIDVQDDEGIPATALREISILKRMDHPNIVKLREVHINYKDTKIYLVFDYHSQDLRQYIKNMKAGQLSKDDLKKFFFQLLSAIDYCHSKGIMHRDLKPQNILISSEGDLKIADFGLARAFNFPIRDLTKEIVTLWYRSPELLLGEDHYDLGVDMWSVGCIMAEFLTQKPLFMGDSQIDQLFKVFQYSGTPTPETWPSITKYTDFKPSFPRFKPNMQALTDKLNLIGNDGIDLILSLLQIDPEKRINAQEGLQHSFFKIVQQQNHDMME